MPPPPGSPTSGTATTTHQRTTQIAAQLLGEGPVHLSGIEKFWSQFEDFLVHKVLAGSMMSACSTRQDTEFISVSSSPVPAFPEPHYLSSLDADSSWRPKKKSTGFPKVSEDYLTQSCWNYFVMISKKIFFSKHSYPKICHIQRVFCCLARGDSACTSGPSFHRSWQTAQLETRKECCPESFMPQNLQICSYLEYLMFMCCEFLWG
ncbi:uncharacterized protein LOC116560598 isoform X2 [Sapajus apella]|uniref:Uncharacterized protein LOC116560598 isoform X2 n=1 Tax=Sapajus apella TaxID=9515 RepID=A0A6J3IZI1_SAPAP|nr:uncharacterized protein LOC116560598 isoform X2 [Sapajus apella]